MLSTGLQLIMTLHKKKSHRFWKLSGMRDGNIASDTNFFMDMNNYKLKCLNNVDIIGCHMLTMGPIFVMERISTMPM